jgi:hypothetical protein
LPPYSPSVRQTGNWENPAKDPTIMPSLQENFDRISVCAMRIADEVNSSLDSYEEKLRGPSQREKMLELGALLANVRQGRREAMELLRGVPSPNKVPAYLAEDVSRIGSALFRFVETCDERERIIWA